MANWFIIDQLGDRIAPTSQILGFWFEDGLPTMGVLIYGPLWFGEDEHGALTIAGPDDGWSFPGLFGIKLHDGTWMEEPQEIHPTHWMPLPEPPVEPRSLAPFIEDLVGRVTWQDRN